jgi:malate/lactate dehydrogenase
MFSHAFMLCIHGNVKRKKERKRSDKVPNNAFTASKQAKKMKKMKKKKL